MDPREPGHVNLVSCRTDANAGQAMTYDPDRTNVLPQVAPAFPITEELPAVGGRGPRRSRRFFLKLTTALLIAAILAIAGVLIIDGQRTDQALPAEQGAEATPEPTTGTTGPAPTAVALEADEPGYWQVVGVPDGLNVRSGPGTHNQIVGALAAGQRHILATGERATVNGSEWKQLAIDNGVGWVSARFLAIDTPPTDETPTPIVAATTVCFRGEGTPTRVARLVFTYRTRLTGTVRTIDSRTSTDHSVEGTLSDGQAAVTLTNTTSARTIRQTWTFNPASVDLGDGTSLLVVGCQTVTELS